MNKTIEIDSLGKMVVPNSGFQNKSIKINAKETSIEVDTGSTYGDITIMLIIGLVIVGSVFSYGYFFGTRDVEVKVAEAVEQTKTEILKSAYEPKDSV